MTLPPSYRLTHHLLNTKALAGIVMICFQVRVMMTSLASPYSLHTVY